MWPELRAGALRHPRGTTRLARNLVLSFGNPKPRNVRLPPVAAIRILGHAENMAMRASIVILAAATAGCASGAALVAVPDDWQAEARREHLRNNRTMIESEAVACRARGGKLGYRGPALAPFCTMRHSDGGKACQSQSECDGECIADIEGRPAPMRTSTPGAAAVGRCTAASPHLGCYIPVEGGKAGQAMCAD